MTSGSHFSSQLPIKVSFLKKCFIPKSSFQASRQDNGNFPTKHPQQSLNREWLKNFLLPRIQISPLHFTSKSDQSCLCTIFLSQLEFHLKFSVVSQDTGRNPLINPCSSVHQVCWANLALGYPIHPVPPCLSPPADSEQLKVTTDQVFFWTLLGYLYLFNVYESAF